MYPKIMKNKKTNHFIGVDVSKLTIDVALIKNNDTKNIQSVVLSNSKEGFREFKKILTKNKTQFQECITCVEHTGYYSRALVKYILQQNGQLWLEMSLKIIRSIGVQRGKNDKLDAKRIALYAHRNQVDYIPYLPPRKKVEDLKVLLMLRDKLMDSKTSLLVSIKELGSVDKASGKMAGKAVRKSIKAIENNITALDNQIDELISRDEQLSHLQSLVTSVPGVGKITFYNLIYFTNEFQNYANGKQLACYCGVVPFEHTSGSSVRGKARVHNMANKKMKKLLHLAAMSAIYHYPEFKEYYERKVSEGKSKMLVLNNVRNKIALRIAAVIRNDKPYQLLDAA